ATARRTGSPPAFGGAAGRSLPLPPHDRIRLRHDLLHELIDRFFAHLHPLPLLIEDVRCFLPMRVNATAAGVGVHRLQEALLMLRGIGAWKSLQSDAAHGGDAAAAQPKQRLSLLSQDE